MKIEIYFLFLRFVGVRLLSKPGLVHCNINPTAACRRRIRTQPQRPLGAPHDVRAAPDAQRILTVEFKDRQSDAASSRNLIPVARYEQIWHFYYIVQLRFSADFVCRGNELCPPGPQVMGEYGLGFGRLILCGAPSPVTCPVRRQAQGHRGDQ